MANQPRVQRLRRSPIKRGCSYQLGCALVSPPIGKALPADVDEVHVRANAVILFAGVLAKIELGGVAMQMLHAHVVIGANRSALVYPYGYRGYRRGQGKVPSGRSPTSKRVGLGCDVSPMSALGGKRT